MEYEIKKNVKGNIINYNDLREGEVYKIGKHYLLFLYWKFLTFSETEKDRVFNFVNLENSDRIALSENQLRGRNIKKMKAKITIWED